MANNGDEMKKLSLYIFLVLMWSNPGFAECIKGNCVNGQGVFAFSNGDKYVGEFRDNKQHGQGNFTFPDGKKIAGLFQNNKFVK